MEALAASGHFQDQPSSCPPLLPESKEPHLARGHQHLGVLLGFVPQKLTCRSPVAVLETLRDTESQMGLRKVFVGLILPSHRISVM